MWDMSKTPWQWNRGRLSGDRAALTVQNFCKIKCLQSQDRKVVIKSLTSQTMQNIWAPHRSVIRLQHHKHWLCYTGPAEPAREPTTAKGGTGVWEGAHTHLRPPRQGEICGQDVSLRLGSPLSSPKVQG